MRNIICRGKRVDNGEWVYGYYVCIAKKCHYIFTGKLSVTDHKLVFEHHAVLPETVGRDTGLTDKIGKMIFEGCIVKIQDEIHVVEYQENEFRFISVTSPYCWLNYNAYKSVGIEVIGNVTDNPDLLPELLEEEE